MVETTSQPPHRHVTIQLEPIDLIRAQQLHFRQSIWSGRGIGYLAVLWVAAIAAFTLLVLTDRPSGTDAIPAVAAFALIAPLVIVPAIFVLAHLKIRLRAPGIFQQQKSLQRPYDLSWSAEGIVLESTNGDARLAWPDLFKARHDRHIITLYEAANLFRLVPKRLMDDAQIQDFEQAIAEGMGEKPGRA